MRSINPIINKQSGRIRVEVYGRSGRRKAIPRICKGCKVPIKIGEPFERSGNNLFHTVCKELTRI